MSITDAAGDADAIVADALSAYRRYDARPTAQGLFEVFNAISATDRLWRHGAYRAFDEALAAGAEDAALDHGRTILARDRNARGAVRLWLASRALLRRKRPAVADALLAMARDREELAFRAPLDLMLFRLRCRVQDGGYGALVERLIASEAPGLPHACVQWIRHRWRYEGPSASLLQDARALALRLRKGAKSVHEECLALALRLGDDEAVVSLLEGRRSLTGAEAHVLPLVGWRRTHTPHAAGSAAAAFMFDAFDEGARALEALIADDARTLAVIGNSPCEKGRGKGQDIDARDGVVRFNRFEGLEDFADDYGARFTHHARGPANDWALHARSHAARRAIFVQSDFLYTPRQWGAFAPLAEAGVELSCLPTGSHRALQAQLHAEPSLGLAFCAYAKSVRPSLSREDCFGFSFVDQIGDGAESAHLQ